MRFYNPGDATKVTRIQRLALRALDAGESLLDAARARILGVADAPEAPSVAPLRATDLGVLLRVEALEARVAQVQCEVEALAPIPVAERRRAAHPCSVCGGRVVLVLEDAPRGPGEWFNGLCAGCRTFSSATPDSEVLP